MRQRLETAPTEPTTVGRSIEPSSTVAMLTLRGSRADELAAASGAAGGGTGCALLLPRC